MVNRIIKNMQICMQYKRINRYAAKVKIVVVNETKSLNQFQLVYFNQNQGCKEILE